MIQEILYEASRLASSERILITTAEWEAAVSIREDGQVYVRYVPTTREIPYGVVAFDSGQQVVVVAPRDYDKRKIEEIEHFSVDLPDPYDRKPAVTLVPGSILPVKDKLMRLYKAGLLPEEAVRLFSGELVKAGALVRVEIGRYTIGSKSYPVYQIREGMRPVGDVIFRYEDLSVYPMGRKEWLAVAFHGFPLKTNSYLVSPATDLYDPSADRAHRKPPVGGFHYWDQDWWVWAVSWTAQEELYVEKDGVVPYRHRMWGGMDLLFVEPVRKNR